jgi:alpha-amylase
VTFVDNHDFSGNDCVVNDKMLAYAYILTHEGYPCVFWQDYFNYALAEPGLSGGIERLVQLHESHAGGRTNLLYVDDLLYVMERTGAGAQPGLVFALNNSGEVLRRRVRTCFREKTLLPLAWRGRNALLTPQEVTTDSDGRCEVEVPPRGYVVYAGAPDPAWSGSLAQQVSSKEA